MTVQPPAYAQGTNDTIKTFPNQPAANVDLFTQITASFRFFLDSFVGQVAKAFGGIEIFGWKPLQFLADWGQGIIDQASANYLAATTAQTTANNANTGVAVVSAQVNASQVSGGIYVTDTFDRPSAADLDATDYDQTYSGAAAGYLGTDGAGNAHWTTFGSAGRTCLVRRKFTLTTDYQSGFLTFKDAMSSPSAAPVAMGIRLRINAANDSWVQGWWSSQGFVDIGYVISGVYTRLGALDTLINPTAPGDLWEFRAGTAASARQFVLLQNNQVVCDRTESGTTSLMGASYRNPGYLATAGVTFFFGLGFAQIPPPDQQAFTAADRTP